MFIQRYLKLDLPAGQSCFLWGARQTGKSTFLLERFPSALYIDLLDSRLYQFYLKNPSALEEQIKANPKTQTIIIDEIQKVPELLDQIHRLIEMYEDKQFILCGSSARRLKSTGANLLGGRAWRYLFVPFCYPELKTLDWKKIFNHGLIPNHYLAKSHIQKYLAAYLFDYILPEVQFEANLRKKGYFSKFLEALGSSHGELINYSNIARDCGIDAKTVRSYFEILEDMYLGYYLKPYTSKTTKRQIIQQTPKFYLFDTGLANYLRKFEFVDMVGDEAGKAFEHYLFLELMAYKLLCEQRDELYFWRTKEGFEVDFIFKKQAIEVKMSASIQKKHLKGLIEFSKENPHQLHLISLAPVKRIISIDDKEITIWPVQEFLEALWTHYF